MGTLTSTLIISLKDLVSGPAAKIQGALTGLQRLDAVGGRLQQSGRALTTGYTAPIALGLGLMTEAASKFEQKMLMVSLANVTGGVTDFHTQVSTAVEMTDKLRTNVLAVSKSLGVSPQFLAGSAALYSKAGINDPQLQQAYLRSTAILGMADPEAHPEEIARTLNSFRTLLKFDDKPAEQIKQLNAEVDRLLFATKHSKYSLGEYQQVLQTILPLTTTLGINTTDTMATIAALSQGGIVAPKAATAFRSFLISLANPTAQGMQAYNQLGIDRSKYFDTGTNMPTNAIQAINREYNGAIKKGDKKALFRMIQDAQSTGFDGDQFDKITQFVSERAAAAGQMVDPTKLAEVVTNALFTATKIKDLPGLIKELSKKGLLTKNANLLPKMFTGRQASNIAALIMEQDQVEEYQKEFANPGPMQDMVVMLRDMSLPGQLQILSAAWERLTIAIGRSGAIGTVVNMLVKMADVLDRIGPSNAQLLATALIGLAAVGPALFLVGTAMRAIAGARAGLALLLGTVTRLLGPLTKLIGLGALGRVASGASASTGRIAGMSAAGAGAAGAGAVGAGAVGRGLLARAGSILVPGLGLVMLGTSVATGAYAAYNDYKTHGSAGGALKAFGWGALTLGMDGGEEEAERPGPTVAAAGQAVSSCAAPEAAPSSGQAEGAKSDLAQIEAAGQQTVVAMQSAMAQVRAIVAAVDLTAEGRRIAQTLAAGIRAGVGDITAAAGEMAAAASRGAVRGAYSDGGMR